MLLGLDSNLKRFIFIAYIALWTNHVILSHLAMTSAHSKSSLVLLTDCLKLCLTLISYSVESPEGLRGLMVDIQHHRVLFILYLVPSGMYFAYNNLNYLSLTYFDPATYSVLMQLRIVVTALLSVFVMRKMIYPVQWFALFIITAGSMVKEVDLSSLEIGRDSWHYCIILLQLLLSTGAGICTEKLLKGRISASTSLHNMFMYFHGMWLNVALIAIRDGFNSTLTSEVRFIISNPSLAAVVVNAALTGLVTGYFLKILGSLLKSIAGALEIPSIAITSFLVFGYPLNASTWLAIALVFSGVLMYSNSEYSKKLS